MTDDMSAQARFAADYARFLCAAHDSFETASVSLPRWWQVKALRSARKPWRPVLDAALGLSPKPDGLILEFGVFNGDSITHMARRKPANTLHGFDSFKGFPDDDRIDWDQNFAVERIPQVPSNVVLHEGYFEATLPPFVRQWGDQNPRIALVHIDCDIFSSTQLVLGALEPWLAPGDIIAFDELMNYTEFASNEFLALYLMLERTGLDFDWAVTWGRAYPLRASEGRMLDTAFDGYRAAGFFQNQVIRLRERHEGGHFDAPPAAPALVDRLMQALAPFFQSQDWPWPVSYTHLTLPTNREV